MVRPTKDVSPAKERVSAALSQLAMTTPIEKITVDMVARTAGINRTTFYYHFRDMDDLVEVVLRASHLRDIARALVRTVMTGAAADVDALYDRDRERVDVLCLVTSLNRRSQLWERLARDVGATLDELLAPPQPHDRERRAMLVEAYAYAILAACAYRGSQGNTMPHEDFRDFMLHGPLLAVLREAQKQSV